MRSLLIASVLALAACAPSTSEEFEARSRSTVMAPLKNVVGLQDCKLYKVSTPDLVTLYVVRCPNSSTNTSYSSGKTGLNTTTIDEVAVKKCSDRETTLAECAALIRAQ